MVTRCPHQVRRRVTNPIFMRLFYYELHILFNVPQAPFPTLARRAKRGRRACLPSPLKTRLHFGHGLILDLHRADRLAGDFQEAVQIGQVQDFRR